MKVIESIKPFAKGLSKDIPRSLVKNAVIYTRVSTKEQADTNQSLETQRKYCLDYANKQALNVLGFFGGTYESAKTDERNEFNRMMRFVKNQKEQVSTILVYSLDRFSRTGDNAIFISSELKKIGVSIFAVTQPIDVSTHAGVLQQNIQFIFSKYDNDLRRDKCVAGMKEKLLKGELVGLPPTGYYFDRTVGKKEQRILMNEKSKIIKKAFLLKVNERLSNIEIAVKISTPELGLSSKRLGEIFRNPFYCGYISHNFLGGELVKGKHEALVSEAVFLAANNIVSKEAFGYKHQQKNNDIPLKAFIKCSECGSPLTGYLVKKKNLYYYKCNTLGCRCNRSAKMMHEKFKDFLKGFEVKEEFFNPLRDQLLRTFENLTSTDREALRMLKQNLSEVEEKIETIDERYALGEIDGLVYGKIITKYNIQKKELTDQIDKPKFKLSNPLHFINNSLKICSNLSELWVFADYDLRRKVQKILFPRGLFYDRKKEQYRTEDVNVIVQLTQYLSGDWNKKNRNFQENISENSGFVPEIGIEPIHLTVHDFESCASTNSATQACWGCFIANRAANMCNL